MTERIRGALKRADKRVTQNGIQKMEREAVKNLMSYVPVCLIDQILAKEPHWDRNSQQKCESFWAAGIFIDISGFSSLASDLNKTETGEKKHMGPSLRCLFVVWDFHRSFA